MTGIPVAFEIIEKVYSTWKTDQSKWSKEGMEMAKLREAELKSLQYGSDADKMSSISGLFGIFEASVKNNIYTYYYWSSDESIGGIYNYTGKRREREWRKLAKCYRVDFDIRTGEAKVTHTRWNKRCVDNAGRIL